MGAAKRLKNGAWERNRRERLNLTFLELSKLLPDHDPTLNIPKVEILTRAIAYIQELQQKYTNMVECCFNTQMKSEMVALKKQAGDLRLRNQQLAELLQRAKINLPGPPAPHTLPFTSPRKWTGKIKKADVKQSTIEKDTTSSSSKKTNENKIKTKKKSKITPCIKRILRSSVLKPVKDLKTTRNNVVGSSTSTPLREIKNMLPVSTSVLTQVIGTAPSLTITDTESRNNLVTVTKAHILTAPIMATGIQPVLERNLTLNRLGPGTLILPDGRVVSVPAPPQTQIIVMPRLITPDTTNTTYVNKVPIPAVSSYNYSYPKASTLTLIKRKLPISNDMNADNRPKKMLLSRANQTEKRPCVKVVKRRSQKTKSTIKLTPVKIVKSVKVTDTAVDQVENQDSLRSVKNSQENPLDKVNLLEKTDQPESETLGNGHKVLEIDSSSLKLKKIILNKSSGNKISVSTSCNNESDSTNNSYSVCENSKENHEDNTNTLLCKKIHENREKVETLPSVKPVDKIVDVNNCALATIKIPQCKQNSTGEHNKCYKEIIDDGQNLVQMIDKNVETSKTQNARQPSPELSSNLSTEKHTQLIDSEVSGTTNKNITTQTLNCYAKNVREEQSIAANSSTKIATDSELENQRHKAVLARCSSSSISEPQNNTIKDKTALKPNNQLTTEDITSLNLNEKQPLNDQNRISGLIVTNLPKHIEYCAKKKETFITAPEIMPSIHELDKISESHKPSTGEFIPTSQALVKVLPISKISQNAKVSCSESSVTNSSLHTSNRPVHSEYSIDSENIPHVNITNTGFIDLQEPATNASPKSSKSTQITTLDNACSANSMKNKSSQASESTLSTELKKISSGNVEKKSSNENKSIIADVSSELTNLFPSDAKLPACSENIFKDADRNLFMPISHSYMDEIRLSLPHADFSNDLFSSLHVPTGGQHPESISPTAAFLLAFPLVSTSKASELITENEVSESQHATPTTILQIGNMESAGNELYHQTSIMIDNNLANIQESLKLNRTPDKVKNGNNLKPQKDFENNFSKLHQIELNEFVRNDSYSGNNNNKEKKQFSGLSEQDLYMSCNKKKTSGKNLDYALSTDVSNTFQEKFFEFGSNNTRNMLIQNPPLMEARHGGINNAQKKDQVPLENIANHQQTYISSSQSYTYNTFPSGNDCSLPNSNYLATNKVENGSLKPSQTQPSYQAIPWSSASVTVTSNSTNYVAPYCAHQQKLYTSVPNKNIQQKTMQNNFEDHRLKEKSSLTGNMLPKFSTNFQFNTNNQTITDIHSYPQTNLSDPNYKMDSKSKKQKTISQRAPVNWMTTPDVRSVMPDINSAALLPDVMFQPQKDLDFNAATHNGQTVQSTSLPNNNQSLYHNTHFSGVDLQLDFVTMPDITSSSKPSRSLSSIPNCQQNPHYSWSPSKSSISLLPHIDSHMIPSTLPTLVGDLALGTTTPSGPLDNCKTLALPSTPFILDQPNQPIKKCELKPDTHKQMGRKPSEKECFSERRNVNNRNMQEYCQKSHAHQSTNTTSSFLSVSQLVDHTKSDQNPSRRTTKPTLNKNSSNLPKRNMNNQHQEKPNTSKMSNMNSNYHPPNRGLINPRKSEFPIYQDNVPVGFLGHPPPYKGGSYSAESLIGDHAGAPPQDHISELPPFSVGNQFPNQFSHGQKPLVSSSNSEYSQQNVQALEFHQSQHPQNCFNYNTHYPGSSYNLDNDYHLGIDQFYNYNQSTNTSRNSTSCQTSSHGNRDSRNVAHKRVKRREEPQFKCPPNHPVTTTLTNFNLSTIFPEINDKRSVQGSNTFHPSGVSSGSKPSESSLTRPGGNPALVAQVGMTPHFPPVNFRPQ